MYPTVLALRILQLTATDANQPSFVQKRVAELIELMEHYLSLPVKCTEADDPQQSAYLMGKIDVTVRILLECFEGLEQYKSLYQTEAEIAD